MTNVVKMNIGPPHPRDPSVKSFSMKFIDRHDLAAKRKTVTRNLKKKRHDVEG